jgi:thiol:disulfide interchange protein DsbD
MSRTHLKAFGIAIALLLATQMLVSCARETKEEAASEVTWLTAYDEAITAAKKNKQPVMIDFYADWCGWCKRLDSDTYVDKDVVALAQDFVSLKIDADAEKSISSKYKVVGLPTILFIDSNGNEIHRVVGYRPPEDFVKEMNAALEAFKG